MDRRRDGRTDEEAGLWWQSRLFLWLCVIVSAVPLLWPAVPPLSDMGDHIGSYRILAEAGRGPLGRHYDVHWAAVGNLGVEGLVLALHRLFDLDIEPAAKLVVLAIPPLTVAGIFALARAAHGRIPATAMLALPLAYGPSLQMGFVNFSLAQALVLLAMALWLYLARRWSAGWRILLFALIAPVIWLTHALGWALLLTNVFAMEATRLSGTGRSWRQAMLRAGLAVAPMASPALLMLKGGGDQVAGDTGGWFMVYKMRWILTLFREQWAIWDIAALIVILLFGYAVIRSRRLSVLPLLAIPAGLGFLIFLILPYVYRGGAYLDMRMLCPAVILAILSVRVSPGRDHGRIAAATTGFFLVRIIGTTIAFAQLAAAQERDWRALSALPPGGRVLVLTDAEAEGGWGGPRRWHIAGIAIARRRVFTNTQWSVPGQHLIRPRVAGAAPYDGDPSSLVFAPGSLGGWVDFDAAIRDFDRCAFDAVWTIGFPAGRAKSPDLIRTWSDRDSAVYRVRRDRCLSDAPSVR
ncbi:hypothetical protein NZL82_04110 [Sphingomonas sanguinis]|uniref:hypothetical protein n=1 Tax=Sphingomonas sp. LC-1 TaxID=3110957 RepID=UPI0021BA8BDE|nr:hypothetical protein [Sphingomonas sp. LC-1]MCT8001059.1 hypothetical protein [Sphingomonas sp. LC-1]